MEQEPQRLLRDEGVIGLNALAVLEAVGRGAERPLGIALLWIESLWVREVKPNPKRIGSQGPPR